MSAVLDERQGSLARGAPAQVRTPLFGHDYVDVVFGVVNVPDHQDDTGNTLVAGRRG